MGRVQRSPHERHDVLAQLRVGSKPGVSRASSRGTRYYTFMAVTRSEAHRWLAGFQAAARADRIAKRRAGPRPEWSIHLALSLLESAHSAAGDHPLTTPGRDRQVERVRAAWDRLRSRLRP
jgi:hypothetical protein